MVLKTSHKDFFSKIWADQLVMTTKRRIYYQITGQGGAATVMWAAEENSGLMHLHKYFQKAQQAAKVIYVTVPHVI